MNRATALVLLGGLGLTAALIAVPGAAPTNRYVPKRDDVVLEHVPKLGPRPPGPLSAEDAAARALALISEAGRSGNDPRLLGRAQATLSPWWNEPSPPRAIRMLRVTLKQRLHDFEGALVDLDAQLADEPTDAQAWLTRAVVLSVLARHPEALAACEHLSKGEVPHAVCRARVLGLTGQAKEAAASLESLRPTPEQAGRVLSVRGELERWSGDDARAQQSLEQALALDPTDTPSRVLLAQLFLDGGQPSRAAQLFEGRVVNDGELLLWVLALGAANARDFEVRRAELDERMAANRQRGETLHRREESRYALALEGDAAKALELATKNWAVRKEPEDARVLLEAAVAMRDPRAAAPALEWLDQTKFSDPTLRALAAKVRAP